MQVCIHRGTKEIGGTCIEIESRGQRIVLDVGLPLDAVDRDAHPLPSAGGFEAPDATLLGVIISRTRAPDEGRAGTARHAGHSDRLSERREQRRIERSAGTGVMSRDGAALVTVSYLLEMWQTFHFVRTFGPGSEQEIEGMKEIRIHLVRHDLDTFKLWHERATLTLKLEDGRRLDGFLDGTSFIASGQLTAA
jgi:hypothetical protein